MILENKHSLTYYCIFIKDILKIIQWITLWFNLYYGFQFDNNISNSGLFIVTVNDWSNPS